MISLDDSSYNGTHQRTAAVAVSRAVTVMEQTVSQVLSEAHYGEKHLWLG